MYRRPGAGTAFFSILGRKRFLKKLNSSLVIEIVSVILL
jgi:hypothetical protein